jgi:hypothetical protein
MLRVAAFFAFLGFILLPATAQISSTGAPASALSPTLDNRHTPIPAGATSPQSFPFFVQPFPTIRGSRTVPVHTFPTHSFSVAPGDPRLRPFGFHNHRQFVPIPVFYPIYGAGYDYSMYPSIADPTVSQEGDPASAESDAAVARSEDALRQAYLQGARDALVEQQRGRQDAKDLMASRSAPPVKAKPADSEAKPAEPDNSPATVFIFKDGHQLETKNYAIMGQMLYDISGTVVKKVPLAELDTAATIKANDDRGITVKLP